MPSLFICKRVLKYWPWIEQLSISRHGNWSGQNYVPFSRARSLDDRYSRSHSISNFCAQAVIHSRHEEYRFGKTFTAIAMTAIPPALTLLHVSLLVIVFSLPDITIWCCRNSIAFRSHPWRRYALILILYHSFDDSCPLCFADLWHHDILDYLELEPKCR
jgi:hypothetical protein